MSGTWKLGRLRDARLCWWTVKDTILAWTVPFRSIRNGRYKCTFFPFFMGEVIVMVFDNNGIVDIQHHKQQERNLTWIISVVVFIFTVAVNLYLFRGSTRHGMEFDEVYRLNNMFPIFRDGVYPYNQAICSLDLGGLSIPLMYKEYISSLHLLPLVPAVFFRDTSVTIIGYHFAVVNLFAKKQKWW